MIVLRSLHLEYRIWIAELNFDINLMRIFKDRIHEIVTAYQTEEIKITTAGFEKRFIDTRTENDDLRHRMHIEKMNLTAMNTGKKESDLNADISGNYEAIKKDFLAYRNHFNKLKNDFLSFENRHG